jgi:hypothetical protein
MLIYCVFNLQGRFSRANMKGRLAYFSQVKWRKMVSCDLFNPCSVLDYINLWTTWAVKTGHIRQLDFLGLNVSKWNKSRGWNYNLCIDCGLDRFSAAILSTYTNIHRHDEPHLGCLQLFSYLTSPTCRDALSHVIKPFFHGIKADAIEFIVEHSKNGQQIGNGPAHHCSWLVSLFVAGQQEVVKPIVDSEKPAQAPRYSIAHPRFFCWLSRKGQGQTLLTQQYETATRFLLLWQFCAENTLTNYWVCFLILLF